TYSIAGDCTFGVSCSTCTTVHLGGSSMTPASGASSPRIAAKRLDLPQPLAPIRPALCPAGSATLARSRSFFMPRESVKSEMRSMKARCVDAARSAELEVVVDDERRVIGKPPVLVDRCSARG